MSLDYTLIRGNLQAATIDELVADDSFRLADYEAIAQKLFPNAAWQAERTIAGMPGRPPSRVRSGHVHVAGVSVELDAFDGCLHLSCRGSGEIYYLATLVARQARDLGLVTIDVQTSRIVGLESAESSPQYLEWYRNVVSSPGG